MSVRDDLAGRPPAFHAGINLRPSSLRRGDRAKRNAAVRAMWDVGMSLGEIATAHRISIAAVRRIVGA